MVCDEVMAGWYRTGSTFAWQQYDFKPDLITFAKGATCGYVPLGGVIAKKEIAEFFNDNVMLCGLTYSAHPVGCAATIATLKEYERLNVKENVKKQEGVLRQLLTDIRPEYRSRRLVCQKKQLCDFIYGRCKDNYIPYGRRKIYRLLFRR